MRMKHRLFYSIVCGLAGLFIVGPCAAQNTSKWNFGLGAGFTSPVQSSSDRLDTGFNITAGAGYSLVPALGLRAEFGFDHLGINSSVLSAAGASSGSTRIYSATLNPVLHFNPHGRYDLYAIGGGGFYRRTVE